MEDISKLLEIIRDNDSRDLLRDLELGDTVEIKGIKFEIEIKDRCYGCIFQGVPSFKCWDMCMSNQRDDDKDVVFKISER